MKRAIAAFAVITTFLSGEALSETRIVDGDTLDIGGTIYRINGIDAPEHGQKCGNWSCGNAATDTLAELTMGKQVHCDQITTDKYQRTIATCYADGEDLGKQMVRSGMAWAFVRFSDVYLAEEGAARSEHLGIWQGNFQPPWDYREAQWNNGDAQAPDGCPIKGNISKNGKIYHAPWSPYYRRTKINTSKGERWFCSEAEAKQAGWRQPYWR